MTPEEAARLGIQVDGQLNDRQRQLLAAQEASRERALAGDQPGDRWRRETGARVTSPADPAAPKPKRKRRKKSKSARRPPKVGLLRGDEGAEAREHILVAGALHRAGVLFFHPPNGGSRSSGRESDELERMGCMRGVPDLMIMDSPPARPGLRGCALEMKAPSTAHPEPRDPPWAWSEFREEQQRWLADLEARGWAAIVAWSAEEAVEQLRELGYPVDLEGRCWLASS